MRNTSLAVLLIALVLTVGCDQVTKSMAGSYLKPGASLSFLGDTIRLQYTQNAGAFLGIGKNLSAELRFWIFIVGAGALLVSLAIYFVAQKGSSFLAVVGCSLILGGGVSNLADRVVNDGRVVDFLNIGIGGIRTGIFNIADVAILVGIAALFVRQSKKQSEMW